MVLKILGIVWYIKLYCHFKRKCKVVAMGNVQAVIDLPEELYLSLSASGLTKERIANESRKLLALKYFKEKVLSLGRAAELSGLSKWDFIEYLSENQVSVIDYDQDEIKREFETSDMLSERLKK
jgi:predicted HTH domain antitoxin